MTRKKRRYSGNDTHFGPFTWSRHSDQGWRPLGVMLDSGGDHEDGGTKGCHLKLHGFGRTLIVELPNFLADYRERHDASKYWDAATIARMGRDWYEEVFPCEYGFTVSDGALHVHYGPQTHDSTTTKSDVHFLPWRELRMVRHALVNPDGDVIWDMHDNDGVRGSFGDCYAVRQGMPKISFAFDDFDGERIQANTHIEIREWLRGTKWCKWLSLFTRRKVSRTLDIDFSKEVGPRKGSWKGGTLGHGIEMKPDETHEDAFRRYCIENNLVFVGRV